MIVYIIYFGIVITSIILVNEIRKLIKEYEMDKSEPKLK